MCNAKSNWDVAAGSSDLLGASFELVEVRVSEEEDVIQVSFSMPIDEDGFLRRECPTCEREFKWLASQDSDDAPSSATTVDQIHCPYCDVTSGPDSWFTPAQLDYASSVAATDVMDPMMEDFVEGFESNDFISLTYERGERASEMPSETNDMTRVDFSCHPDDPVKVDGAWDGDVHCLVCGASSK